MVLLSLSSLAFAESGAAADCELCLDSVGLQTRDGQPWSAGKPVTLVVRVASHAAAPLPPSAEAVVMQTDGDRTKCLGVPLKLVQVDASGGLYAGLFFPFRPARYDGKLAIGDDLQDITFDVNQMVAGAGPADELPAAEPIDTSAPARTLIAASHLPAVGAAAVALGSLVALGGLYARQRRRPAGLR
ncbi:MAG TPA: hypothetical protein VGL23_06705 [Chloroflexota bacterium]|jgi:hypothetical protein